MRWSHPNQKLGDTQRRQMQATERYCAEYGLELLERLSDEGLSAYSGAHRKSGALGAFLERVRAGKVPHGLVLIVESLDRLSREKPLVAQRQFTDILEAGVTIVTLMDRQCYTWETINQNIGALQLSLMHMCVASIESSKKAERLQEVWGEKRKKAETEKEVMSSNIPGWLVRTKGRQPDGTYFKTDERRVATVNRIYRMAADGMGYLSIARALNAEGVAMIHGTKRGSGMWAPSSVRYLVGNIAVEGMFQRHTGRLHDRKPVDEPVEGYFPRIVDATLVAKARAAAASRRNTGAGRKGKGLPNLIGGLARCGVCDGGMAFMRGGGGGRPDYIRCYSANKGAGCANGARYHYKRIETAILDRVPYLVCEITSSGDETARLTAERDTARDAARKAEARAARATQRMLDEDDVPKSVLTAIRAAEAEAAREDACADEINARIVAAEREASSAEAAFELTAEVVEAAFDAQAADDDLHAAKLRLQQMLRAALWAVFCLPDGKDGNKAVALLKGGWSFQIERDGDVHGLSQHLPSGVTVTRGADGTITRRSTPPLVQRFLAPLEVQRAGEPIVDRLRAA